MYHSHQRGRGGEQGVDAALWWCGQHYLHIAQANLEFMNSQQAQYSGSQVNPTSVPKISGAVLTGKNKNPEGDQALYHPGLNDLDAWCSRK